MCIAVDAHRRASLIRSRTSSVTCQYYLPPRLATHPTLLHFPQSYFFPSSLNISGLSDSAQFNYTSALLLSVRLTGLKPSTTYYYRIGEPPPSLPYRGTATLRVLGAAWS